MVNEDTEVSRNNELHALDEFYGPTYPDLTSAPNQNGILVEVDGSGADPAGYYAYTGNSWSGPYGGPSNLPDTVIDDTTTVANTETYAFEQYLSATEDANDAKRVNLDVDTSNLDERYLKNYEDDFEVHDPTDPTVDQPLTPRAWRFEPGSASAAVPGGYYYTDTPDGITSTRSFGCDFESATAPDGSTIQASTWALAQEFAVGAGGHDLTVSAYARPTADYASYDDGNTHADTETYVGADDAFVEIQCYDASLQPLAGDITTLYSDTASEQHFAAGNTSSLSGSTWVTLEHTATLPADTAYVEVRLQAADAGDMWATRGTTGSGHAAILFDDFQAHYTAGLRRSGVLGHDHDTQYAPLGHTSATDNPHDVTATQAGALADVSGSVLESNLGFDTATQSELDSHAGTAGVHHSRYGDSEAVSAVESSSPLDASITGNAATADNASKVTIPRSDGQNWILDLNAADDGFHATVPDTGPYELEVLSGTDSPSGMKELRVGSQRHYHGRQMTCSITLDTIPSGERGTGYFIVPDGYDALIQSCYYRHPLDGTSNALYARLYNETDQNSILRGSGSGDGGYEYVEPRNAHAVVAGPATVSFNLNNDTSENLQTAGQTEYLLVKS